MEAKIINLDCFTGFHNLSRNCYDEEDIQALIDRYEAHYLKKILGNDLANDLYADLDTEGVPQDSLYTVIFDALYYEGQVCYEEVSYDSFGLKDILTGFCFYHIITDERFEHTATGLTKANNENSSMVDAVNSERFAEMRYNQAAEGVRAIQAYIQDNSTDYPTYKGKIIENKFLDIV